MNVRMREREREREGNFLRLLNLNAHAWLDRHSEMKRCLSL